MEDLRDLIRCASVNRTWRQACQHVRPAALSITAEPQQSPSGYRPQSYYRRKAAVYSCLQRLVQQDCLLQLRHVRFTLGTLCCQAVALVAKSPILTCSISSNALAVDVQPAIQCMPSTLQQLKLCCCSTPRELPTSWLTKLNHLEKLTLHIPHKSCELRLDAPLPRLQELSLTSVYGPASFEHLSCNNISSRLPKLRYLSLDDYASSPVLYTVLSLSSLVGLQMHLRASNSEGHAPVTLVLEKSCQLQELTIAGPHALVTLLVRKRGVRITTGNIRVLHQD